MTKLKKVFPVLIVLSVLVIVAGIVVGALFGFNYAAESRTIEVKYDAIIHGENETKIQEICEAAFDSASLKYENKATDTERDSSYLGQTGDKRLSYTFSASVEDGKLTAAANSIRDKIEGDASFEQAEISVSVNHLTSEHFYTATWRGAVALFVGAVVALVYVGFRFGVGQALVGLVFTVHDALLAVALLAVTRIPTYAYAPMLIAAIAAVLSLALWIVRCAKMRTDFKDPAFAAYTAEEAVAESCKGSFKYVLSVVIATAAVFVILGAVGASGLRLFMLTALLSLAASVYSSLLLAPQVYVPIKAKFDRFKVKQKRYVGKKKDGETEEN